MTASSPLAANNSALEKSYSNVMDPHAHDVLCGRGAGITKHPGNKRWRELIHNNRERYTSLPRNQRPMIAESIVKAVRSLNPPGRFLTKDAATKLWYDIGDERAAEKTAQAMRDSKKNSKDTPTGSPTASPTMSPLVVAKKSVTMPVVLPAPFCPTAVAPAAQCSPTIARPDFNRISTDDSFCQKMEGFVFPPPMMEQTSAFMMEMAGSSSHHSPKQAAAHCSPKIVKPAFARDSTFDKKLETFASLPPPFHSRESGFSRDSGMSMASFGILPEDELEILEASCEIPSQEDGQQQPKRPQFVSARQRSSAKDASHFYADLGGFQMKIEEDGDVIMDEVVAPVSLFTKRTDPNNQVFHWSV